MDNSSWIAPNIIKIYIFAFRLFLNWNIYIILNIQIATYCYSNNFYIIFRKCKETDIFFYTDISNLSPNVSSHWGPIQSSCCWKPSTPTLQQPLCPVSLHRSSSSPDCSDPFIIYTRCSWMKAKLLASACFVSREITEQNGSHFENIY